MSTFAGFFKIKVAKTMKPPINYINIFFNVTRN